MNPNLSLAPLLDELKEKPPLELATLFFQQYRARCFWNSPDDLVITERHIPFVRQRLRDYGNRETFILSGLLRPRESD